MTLYIIYDYFFPAFKAGGPIQSLVNLVEYMEGKASLKVVCSNRDLGGEILDVTPDEWTNDKYKSIFYSSYGFGYYKKQIPSSENRVVFINGIYSWEFNFMPALLLKGRKIISVRGMLHTHALAQKSTKKNIYLKLWKLLGLHLKCEYHATSEEEKGYILQKFGKKVKVWVIPNFPKVLSYENICMKEAGELVMSTIAVIGPMKNVHLVLKALMHCRSRIVYNIYGPIKDIGYWQDCQQLITQLPANVIANYCGHIPPDNISQALKSSHIYIQPSQSENFGHSIFEALSAGRPVITSCRTPWNELADSQAGYNVSVAHLFEMSGAIEKFAMMNHSALESWSRQARAYALRAIDTDKIRKQYLNMFGVALTE